MDRYRSYQSYCSAAWIESRADICPVAVSNHNSSSTLHPLRQRERRMHSHQNIKKTKHVARVTPKNPSPCSSKYVVLLLVGLSGVGWLVGVRCWLMFVVVGFWWFLVDSWLVPDCRWLFLVVLSVDSSRSFTSRLASRQPRLR